MKKILILLLCGCLLTACGNSEKSESSISETSSLVIAEGELGEVITPDESDKDYNLGEYRYSSSGTKLYFNEDEYPKELMLTLEKYFNAFAENDFETYKSCLSPLYAEKMNAYLEENYNYGLETSFDKQREGLSEKMGGDFKITRIRAEKTEEDNEKAIEEYFSDLNDFFGDDFYSEVKENSDKFYHMTFFVIAEDSENVESLLLSEYEIIFAEKDGNYYTFV